MARKKAPRLTVPQGGNRELMQSRQARRFSGAAGTHTSGNRRMGTRRNVKQFEINLSA